MLRRLSIRLLERLYNRSLEKSELVNKSIDEYKRRIIELKQEPDPAVINKYLNTPGINIWLSEDCAGYKRGRKLDDKDISNIKQQGFESVWISDMPVKDFSEEKSKYADLSELREQLADKLSEIFITIDERDAGSKRKGSKIDLLEGSDLLGLRIDPLQKEGAGRIATKILGETGSKLEPIKNLIDQLYALDFKTISLSDNRTLGNIQVTPESENKIRTKVNNYLLMHSINVGILFNYTLKNIQRMRLEEGTQSSTARYTAGQKFNKDLRVAYNQDIVKSACLGSFIFDIGFNHSSLKRILDKEMKELINPEGEAIHKGFVLVANNEYEVLKRHVNVGSHIVQNLGVDATSIITNMIRTHHCYLNGEGYPKRQGQDYQLVLTREDGSKYSMKVFRFETMIHELSNLLSIIDTYDAMINRRPWRLPFSRYETLEYIYESSEYAKDPETGKEDTAGRFSFNGTEKRNKRFDRYLVNMFFNTLQPYNMGEILPLRDTETNKKLGEAIVIKHTAVPHRPIVRIVLKDKAVEINLSEKQFHRYCLGEYVVTAFRNKKDEKEEQLKQTQK